MSPLQVWNSILVLFAVIVHCKYRLQDLMDDFILSQAWVVEKTLFRQDGVWNSVGLSSEFIPSNGRHRYLVI